MICGQQIVEKLGAGLHAADHEGVVEERLRAPLRRTLESQLYGVGVADPRVLGGVAALLSGVALIACWLPARKAARTDPVIALTDQ